jgi:hypothetical protein
LIPTTPDSTSSTTFSGAVSAATTAESNSATPDTTNVSTSASGGGGGKCPEKKPVKPYEIKINPEENAVERVKIESLMLITNNDNTFTKEYTILNDEDPAYLSILREIVLHYYAIDLMERVLGCPREIIVPKIIRITMRTDGENLVISITMDLLNGIINFTKPENETIKSQILENWEMWKGKIIALLSCFESNGLFHNDTHVDNLIFIKTGEEVKMALFDFGKSTLLTPFYPTTTGFPKAEDISKVDFERWINNGGDEFCAVYGGRKTKKTSKRPYKKRKTARRKKGTKRRR